MAETIKRSSILGKKKLFILTGGFGYGGTERFLFDLLQGIDRSKFDIFVGCYRSGGPLLPDLPQPPIEIGANDTIKLIRIPLVLYRLIRHMRLQRFDVVYATHFQTNFYLALASLMTKRAGVILGYRGLNPGLGLGGKCVSFFASRIADRIIVNSKAAYEMLVRTTAVCPKKIRLVHNGVELREAGDDSGKSKDSLELLLNVRQTHKIVASIGRLHEIKGHSYLLRAFALLANDYPDTILCIIGDGPERQKLEDLALQLGIGSKVIFVGFCPTNRDILQKIDIFVLPSLSESFPNALLEAMAAGLPSVATAVGGVTEIIEDGVDGLLVPCADVSRIEKAIRLLLSGSDQYLAGIRQNACRKASFFTKERMVREVEAVFEEVLNEKAEGGRKR